MSVACAKTYRGLVVLGAVMGIDGPVVQAVQLLAELALEREEVCKGAAAQVLDVSMQMSDQVIFLAARTAHKCTGCTAPPYSRARGKTR